MVNKFLSGAALSATIIAANVLPLSANPTTNLKNGNSVPVNSVAPKSSLVEFGGRTLTDAEAAKVEGEALPVLVIVGGKLITKFVVNRAKAGVRSTAVHSAQCVTARVQNCNAQSHGAAFRSGATFGLWR
jgi:hypothetical protein